MYHSNTHLPTRRLLIIISLLSCLTNCTSLQRKSASGQTFSFVATAGTRIPNIQLSDQKALIFSDNVASAFRTKAGTSRYIREASSSTQVTLAALAGASPTLNLSKSALAGLGFGSALIPDFQGIFNAKGRAEAYTDAVRLIETAQNEFLAYNQNPSATELTQNGVTLIQRTQASIHVVESTLAGRIPSVVDMKQATEKMSKDGAKETMAGESEAVNHVTAEGELPTLRQPKTVEEGDEELTEGPSTTLLSLRTQVQDAIDEQPDGLSEKAKSMMSTFDPDVTGESGFQFLRTKAGLRELYNNNKGDEAALSRMLEGLK